MGSPAPEPPTTVGDATELDPAELYRRLRSAGQQHGPAFQGIERLAVYDDGVARAAVRLPSLAKQGSRRFLLHPVMVDIALQALGASKVATDLAAMESDEPTVILPVRLAGVRVVRGCDRGPQRGRLAAGDLAVETDSSAMYCSPAPTGGYCWRSTRSKWWYSKHRSPADDLTSRLFALDWEPVDLDTPTTGVKALLLVGDAATADPLLNTLADRADRAHRTLRGDVGP